MDFPHRSFNVYFPPTISKYERNFPPLVYLEDSKISVYTFVYIHSNSTSIQHFFWECSIFQALIFHYTVFHSIQQWQGPNIKAIFEARKNAQKQGLHSALCGVNHCCNLLSWFLPDTNLTPRCSFPGTKCFSTNVVTDFISNTETSMSGYCLLSSKAITPVPPVDTKQMCTNQP